MYWDVDILVDLSCRSLVQDIKNNNLSSHGNLLMQVFYFWKKKEKKRKEDIYHFAVLMFWGKELVRESLWREVT